MRTLVSKTLLLVALLGASAGMFPVSARAQASSPVAPTLIPVSGRLVGADGQPRAGQVSLVISLYNAQNDASPRWVEQQMVTLDPSGAYSVQFGATLPDGLPSDLFATEGGARWLGVAVREASGDVEQPRVMLVSVPYAAKAAIAETLGGRSVSEFVLTSTFRDDLRTVLEEEGVTRDSGEVSAEAIANSVQKSNGAGGLLDTPIYSIGGNIGYGTSSPLAQMHLAGLEPRMFVHYTGTPAAGIKGGLWFFHNRGGDNAIEALGRIEGIAENAFSNGGFRFVTRANSDVEVMRFVSTGNVGIGTDTPGAFRMFVNATGDSIARFRTNGGGGQALDVAHSSGVIGLNSTGSLGFSTNGSERLRIDATGNIGVGTATPAAKLHVAGNVRLTGDVVVDGNIAAKYQDVAEWVPAVEPLEAGTLVVIDRNATNHVAAAKKAYDGRVAGAVSPQPGLILGERGEGKVLVAQSGRVRVKADARFGAIRPGDLLVSSPTKGHVMRSRPVKIGEALVHRPGTVVGKALEPLAKGQGDILVLLTLQ
jgi:hypothetical protein